MQEACLICEGTGTRDARTCPYCTGSGRVKVHTDGPQTVLVATGSCKVPMRKVILEGGSKVERRHSAPQGT